MKAIKWVNSVSFFLLLKKKARSISVIFQIAVLLISFQNCSKDTSVADSNRAAVNSGIKTFSSLTTSSTPDVVVTSLSYANGIFTSTIKNQGTAATPSGVVIGVAYYMDGVYKTYGSVSGPLAAGASVSIGTNGGAYNIPDGTHSITAFVDDNNRFSELNETNNKLTQPISIGVPPAPDVVVTSLSYANGIFTSTIKNQGTAATPSGVVIGVAYYVDGVYKTYGSVSGPLAAGASVSIGTNGSAFTISDGAHSITAFVDDNNRFSELNETNNKITQPISIGVPPAPDAVVSSLTYANGIFTSTIKNQGTAATPSGVIIGVAYYVDGVYKTYGSVSGPLAAGASVSIGTNGSAFTIPDGAHSITAFVDDNNRFSELNETNNKLSQSINIGTAPASPTSPSTATPSTATPSNVAVHAFPEAQGGGANSLGGRGGAVIEVTNLSDSGPGSLRACVSASGPRTCVFRVAGIIQLLHALDITNPYLTIAGQTAPGGGILLSGTMTTENMIILDTHDVIIRYIRIRKGLNKLCSGECGANQTTWSQSYNIVLDHVSSSWNQDEGLSAWSGPSYNFTFSYNLIAEGLYPHATSMLLGGNPTAASQMINLDVHHTLMMNNNSRNPFLGNKSSRFVNNINYNQKNHAMQLMGGINVDVIGNINKKGPMSAAYHEIQALDDIGSAAAPGSPSIYLSGNIGWSQSNPAGDQWLLAQQVTSYNGSDAGPVPTAWKRSSPLANTAYPIVAEPVANLEGNLLPIVGASRRVACDGSWVSNRDSVDLRLINQYKTNTGLSNTISSETEVGGFPVIAAGTPCVDSDHDGMPDIWETAHGLKPNDPSDRNGVASNGYTNLENYINGQ